MRKAIYTDIGRLSAVVLLLSVGAACKKDRAGTRESVPGAAAKDDEKAQSLLYPAALKARLKALGSERAQVRPPRTKHVQKDGTPIYSNRLLLTSSPYLQQHAHNPVNWFPWGDEAFDIASKLNRPVFLSVGYSTCHWCHVMEEESFEDLEVAKFINDHYVAIKVDREERPDVDAIYMEAVRSLTGSGGWPMSVWLTEERTPFFGGTYFPARDGDRGSRKGFLTLLRELRSEFDADPGSVQEKAQLLTMKLNQSLSRSARAEGGIDAEVLSSALFAARKRFDPHKGGAKQRRKFPSSLPMRFLLREHLRTGAADALSMATTTLDSMADGGIYDHVAGGFHRYSTDPDWLVPHFEKMLYDNALLLRAYTDAFQVTKNEEYKRIALEIVRYIGREMTSPGGGFYSATDADSLGHDGEMEEGTYFSWTPSELAGVLAPAELDFVTEHFGITPQGNFEGRNLLHTRKSLAEMSRGKSSVGQTLRKMKDNVIAKLYAARQQRKAPLRDDKILAAWNGLMISAMANAGFVLKSDHALKLAEDAARYIENAMHNGARLLRSVREGNGSVRGYADDYAFMIDGLLELYQATGKSAYFKRAQVYDVELRSHHESDDGGLYVTAGDAEPLLARERSRQDGAVPSASSYQALNLYRFAAWTGDDTYRKRAEAMVGSVGRLLKSYPLAVSEMLLAVDFAVSDPWDIVVVRGANDDAGWEKLREVLRDNIKRPRVVSFIESAEGASPGAVKTLPPLEGKTAVAGKSTAYVCTQGVCQKPTTDPVIFRQQVRRAGPKKL